MEHALRTIHLVSSFEVASCEVSGSCLLLELIIEASVNVGEVSSRDVVILECVSTQVWYL